MARISGTCTSVQLYRGTLGTAACHSDPTRVLVHVYLSTGTRGTGTVPIPAV
eukprot:SAG11_NODE_3115_length_2676_cov_7.504075_1_plen_51_part_10